MYRLRGGSKCHAQKVGVTHLQTQQLQSKPIESGCSNRKSRKHNTARRVSSCHRFTFDTLQYILNYGVQAKSPSNSCLEIPVPLKALMIQTSHGGCRHGPMGRGAAILGSWPGCDATTEPARASREPVCVPTIVHVVPSPAARCGRYL